MKKFNPKDISIRDFYHLMISSISPRPIAFVGSVDSNGKHNLAPFSFFNGFGANPPIVGFSPALSGKTGLPKDTLLNIKETKEFTISVVTKDIIEQVSLSSCEYPKNIDEFSMVGLNKFKTELITSPGVKEAPVIMECKLLDIIELGNLPASGNLILGEIILLHINQNVLNKDNKIDSEKINHIGRSGKNWYVESNKSMFEIIKPRGIGVGFNNLPSELINSDLTGNQLAKMASVSFIPKIKKNINFNKLNIVNVIEEVSKSINSNDIENAWQIILNWKINNE